MFYDEFSLSSVRVPIAHAPTHTHPRAHYRLAACLSASVLVHTVGVVDNILLQYQGYLQTSRVCRGACFNVHT
jgi:hypothetical protein